MMTICRRTKHIKRLLPIVSNLSLQQVVEEEEKEEEFKN
jgi:hypothetical protein